MTPSSELPCLVTVEALGQSRSPMTPNMSDVLAGRIAVLAEGEGVDRLLAAVARSLGKRRRAGRLPDEERGTDRLDSWLKSEGIADIFIGCSERLTEGELKVLIDWSDLARIWLLFSAEPTAVAKKALRGRAAESVHRNSMARWLSAKDSGYEQRWDGFPLLPLDEVLRFRGRCVETLDAVEVLHVDAAIEIGIDHARDVLFGDPDDVDVVRVAGPGLSGNAPLWPSLAMLRGAQLGALSIGWNLTFDTGAWLQARRAIPSIPLSVVPQLRESMDPYDAALVVVYVTTCASSDLLARLTVDDVDLETSVVYCQGHKFAIPNHLQPPVGAHVRNVSGAGETSLFSRKGGASHTAVSIERRLKKALTEFGLPPALETNRRITRNSSAIADIATYVEATITKAGAL